MQRDDEKVSDVDGYQARATIALAQRKIPPAIGELDAVIRRPYERYREIAARMLRPGMRVLELGAGTGAGTAPLCQPGVEVVATDLAEDALRVLELRAARDGLKVSTAIADLESLPFDAKTFDAVACSGSLSYGDPIAVDREILRVLRPGGLLLGVDAMDGSPIYRANRTVQAMLGRRSWRTVAFMPTLSRLNALLRQFEKSEVRSFGSLDFLLSPASRLIGDHAACAASAFADRIMPISDWGFKCVYWGEGAFARQRE